MDGYRGEIVHVGDRFFKVVQLCDGGLVSTVPVRKVPKDLRPLIRVGNKVTWQFGDSDRVIPEALTLTDEDCRIVPKSKAESTRCLYCGRSPMETDEMWIPLPGFLCMCPGCRIKEGL